MEEEVVGEGQLRLSKCSSFLVGRVAIDVSLRREALSEMEMLWATGLVFE
jgi:hypothetical protein